MSLNKNPVGVAAAVRVLGSGVSGYKVTRVLPLQVGFRAVDSQKLYPHQRIKKASSRRGFTDEVEGGFVLAVCRMPARW